MIFGMTVIITLFNTTDAVSNVPIAAVTPNTNRNVFLILKLCEIDNMAIFVGPGVIVTITQ